MQVSPCIISSQVVINNNLNFVVVLRRRRNSILLLVCCDEGIFERPTISLIYDIACMMYCEITGRYRTLVNALHLIALVSCVEDVKDNKENVHRVAGASSLANYFINSRRIDQSTPTNETGTCFSSSRILYYHHPVSSLKL